MKKQLLGEFFAGLFLILIISGIIAIVASCYLHDNKVLATSKDIVVTVTGKKIGGGKKNPRIVYIRDGAIPIGIKTTARWYFQTKVGQLTTVKYSPVYHEYRQPYHNTNPEKYFLAFMCIMGIFSIVQITSVARNIWFVKKYTRNCVSNSGYIFSIATFYFVA